MHRPLAPISEGAGWAPSGWPDADLARGVLHVWRADLDSPIEIGALSREERERAARFLKETHRLRWSRSRELLRRLLGAYLERGPEAIEFAEGPHGKPAITDGDGIEFNLSHSGSLVVVAVASGNPLGVDVEAEREVREPLAIAGRVFGAEEAERLRSLPEADRRREFLRSWVRYEAALKCRGGRLGAPADGTSTHLIDLNPGRGAAAAVALEQPPSSVVLRELRDSVLRRRPG
jgi:4'-phosphopantetheinyl transferase